MFSKQDYRMRRENKIEIKDDKGNVVDFRPSPLRGQGDYPITEALIPDTKSIGTPRRAYRSKLPKRYYRATKKVLAGYKKGRVKVFRTITDEVGIKFTQKGASHQPNPFKNGYNIRPTKDPSMTNHQRLLNRHGRLF